MPTPGDKNNESQIITLRKFGSYLNQSTQIPQVWKVRTTSVMLRIFLVIVSLSWPGVGVNQSFWNVSFTSFWMGTEIKIYLEYIKSWKLPCKFDFMWQFTWSKNEPWSPPHRWLCESSWHTSQWSCGSLAVPGKYLSWSWWPSSWHWYLCPVQSIISLLCIVSLY